MWMCLESFYDEIIYYPEIVVDNVHFWTKTESLQNGFYSKIKSKLVLVVPLVLVLKVLIETYKTSRTDARRRGCGWGSLICAPTSTLYCKIVGTLVGFFRIQLPRAYGIFFSYHFFAFQ